MLVSLYKKDPRNKIKFKKKYDTLSDSAPILCTIINIGKRFDINGNESPSRESRIDVAYIPALLYFAIAPEINTSLSQPPACLVYLQYT